jgi:hypothetical protein
MLDYITLQDDTQFLQYQDMRKFDIMVCSVLKMKSCGDAPVNFGMSVSLVPLNLRT